MKILCLIEDGEVRTKKARFHVETNGGRFWSGWCRKMTDQEIIEHASKINKKNFKPDYSEDMGDDPDGDSDFCA